MEFRDSEISRRFSKRKALGDVSNTVLLRSVSVPCRKFKVKTEVKQKLRAATVNDGAEGSSIGSCNSPSETALKIVRSRPSSKVADPPSESGVPSGSLKPVIPCTNRREKRQRKKKSLDVEIHHSSCPSRKRLKNASEKQTTGPTEDTDRRASASAPNAKLKRKWRYMLSSDDEGQPQTILPRQFIEEQRAYFTEVDAFELAEEVVSEDELE
ncbi:uncharacterized protein LOC144706900 [Wolffia australiana]